MTLPGIWGVERFGRRNLLLFGAAGMCICEFIVAIVGVTISVDNLAGQRVLIAFVCIYIVSELAILYSHGLTYANRHSSPPLGDLSVGLSLVRFSLLKSVPKLCLSRWRATGCGILELVMPVSNAVLLIRKHLLT